MISFLSFLVSVLFSKVSFERDYDIGDSTKLKVLASLLVPEAYEVLKREIFGCFLMQGFYPVEVLHVPSDLCYAILHQKLMPMLMVSCRQWKSISKVLTFFLDNISVMGFVASHMFCLIFLPTQPSGPILLGAFQ